MRSSDNARVALRWAAVGIAVTLTTASPRQAIAQWLVVGVADEPADARREAMAALGASDLGVVASDVAAATFGSAVGAEASELDADRARALGSAAEAALEDAAFGRNAAVLERVGTALSGAASFLTAIGAADRARTDVGNLCLFAVRAHLQMRASSEAEAQALECIRLVPDIEPSSQLHPRNVRELVATMRERVRAGEEGVVSVVATSGSESGCEVLMNGRPMGRTPEARITVAAGVQEVAVRCGESTSLVRSVDVPRSEPVRVVVPLALALAAGVDDVGITLRTSELPAADVAVLGAAVGATDFLFVGAGELVHHHVDGPETSRVVARARLGSDVRAAVSQLLDRGERPGVAHVEDETLPRPSTDIGHRAILGPVLLGVVGLAAAGIVIGTVVAAGCVREDAGGECLEEDRIAVGPTVAYAAIGAAALVTGILWFALSGGGSSDDNATSVGVGPTSVLVRGRF